MRLELSLPREVFVQPEEVDARLSVVNDGAAPVEIPDPFRPRNGQPRYHIKGPEYPLGRTFAPGETPERGSDAVLVTLAAGEAREGDVSLGPWLRSAEPGRYEVVVELAWKSLRAKSPPIEIAIDALSVRSAAIGVDAGSPRASDVFAGWLHGGEKGSALFSALCTEKFEHGAHYDPPSGRFVGVCGPDARDLLLPWANGDRKEDTHNWRAWREGAAIFALASAADAPVRADVGTVPDRIIRPALMGPEGDLDIFAIAAGGKELVWVRFPAPQPPDDAPKGPPVVKRVALERAVVAGRTALAPRKLGSRPHVVLMADDPDESRIDVQVWSVDEKGDLRSIATAAIPNVYVMTNARPGLRIDEDGFVHAATLYFRDLAARRAGVADLVFGPDGMAREVSMNGFGVLPRAPRAASLVYSVTPAWPVRRDWVALLDDGTLVSSRTPDEPWKPSAPPARPLELLPLTGTTYLLVIDPKAGPKLEIVR